MFRSELLAQTGNREYQLSQIRRHQAETSRYISGQEATMLGVSIKLTTTRITK